MSLTPSITLTPTIPLTPSVTATVTDTPETPIPSPTATDTETVTAVPTPTGPTPTPFGARSDFIIAQGSTNDTVKDCTLDAVTGLGFTSSVQLLQDLFLRGDPARLLSQFLTVYVPPGLSEDDYTTLNKLAAPNGFIEQFVALGGVAVINVAPDPAETPTTETRTGIAPGFVGYQPPLASMSETIAAPSHPFITGEGFGGHTLSSSSFASWQPTDRGFLTGFQGLPSTVLLRNARGPSMIEYNYGAGRVIVTSLTFCTQTQPASQGDALDNLLTYGRFYRGRAQTPAFTVTPTGTPTPTITGQATTTRTRTRTPTLTPLATLTPVPTDTETPADTPTPQDTATATPVACGGDCDGDGVVSINELITLVSISLGTRDVSDCLAGDVNGPQGHPDGEITIDELIRAVGNAQSGCPTPAS